MDGEDILDSEYRDDDQTDDDDDGEDIDDVPVDENTIAGTYFFIENANGYTKFYGPLWYLYMYNLYIGRIDEDQTKMDLVFCDQKVEMTDEENIQMNVGIPGMTYLDVNGNEVILPSIKAVPAQTYVFTEEKTFSPDTAYWVWGLEMEDWSVADDFPATPDEAKADSRVFDEDEDGNPGVTIHIENPDGFRWMVRRSEQTFSKGTRSTDKQYITGQLLSWDWVQHAVGSEGIDKDGNPTGKPSLLVEQQLDILPRTDIDSTYALRILGSREDAKEDTEGQVYAEDDDDQLCAYLRANFKAVLLGAFPQAAK